MLSFIHTGLPVCRPVRAGYRRAAVCTAQKPGSESKPGEDGETVWGEFGTEGRMKKKRVRRRQTEEEDLDWDNLPSVPLVRSDASPESGEDYWMELDNVNKSDKEKEGENKPEERKKIDDEMKERLKQEVVSPYTQNWILRVVIVVAVLIVLVAIFGGAENTPIISVPDL